MLLRIDRDTLEALRTNSRDLRVWSSELQDKVDATRRESEALRRRIAFRSSAADGDGAYRIR